VLSQAEIACFHNSDMMVFPADALLEVDFVAPVTEEYGSVYSHVLVVPLTAVMDKIVVVVVCVALLPSAVAGVKEHSSY